MGKKRQLVKIEEEDTIPTQATQTAIHDAAESTDASPVKRIKLADEKEPRILQVGIRNMWPQPPVSPEFHKLSAFASAQRLPMGKKHTHAMLLSYTEPCDWFFTSGDMHNRTEHYLAHGFKAVFTDGQCVAQFTYCSSDKEEAQDLFHRLNLTGLQRRKFYAIANINQPQATTSCKDIQFTQNSTITDCNEETVQLNFQTVPISRLVVKNLPLHHASAIAGYMVPNVNNSIFYLKCDCQTNNWHPYDTPLQVVDKTVGFVCKNGCRHPDFKFDARMTVAVQEHRPDSGLSGPSSRIMLFKHDIERILGTDIESYVLTHLSQKDLSKHCTALLTEFENTKHMIFVMQETKCKETVYTFVKIIHFYPSG